MSKLDAKVFSSITPFAKQWILGEETMYEFLAEYPQFLSDSYGIVDLGSLEWTATEYAGVVMMRAALETHSHGADSTNIYCLKYETSNDIWSSTTIRDKLICNNYNGQLLYVYDSEYTSADEFKAAMQGIYLIYEKK